MSPRTLLLTAAALTLLQPSVSLGAQTIDARGRVELAGGEPVAGVEVRADVHDGSTVVYSATAVTDANGVAAWPQLPAAEGRLLRLAATYEGVEYTSQTVALGADPVELAVTVHPVSSDGRPLHLDTLHLIVQVDEPGRFRVLQFMTVSNAGEPAFAGGPELSDGSRAGVVIPLPTAATAVQPAPFPSPDTALDLGRAEIGSDRVLDGRPVPPEGRQVAITYDLVSDGDPVDVTLTLPYPTQSVSLLVGGTAAEGILVTETNLEAQPDEQIGEQQYGMWTAQALSPGTEVRFTLGPPGVTISTPAWALIGLSIGLALAVAASFVSRGPADRADMRRAIVERVATLDDRFEAGDIEREQYFRLRGAEVERLMLLEPDRPSEDA